MSRTQDARRVPGVTLAGVSPFDTPDASVLDSWGEPVLFMPKAGGSFDVTMATSTTSPYADVQPAPILVLFGTLDDSGFTDAGAPLPVRGDSFAVDGVTYECYLVKQDRAGGTPGTNGTWCYLTQAGG